MKTPIERFEAKYEAEPTSGCWIWTAARVNGYGRFGLSAQQTSVLAYRWIYERLVGPVPKGKELDHLCRNRACVNPAHLEAVSRSENHRRSPVANGGRVACWRGHAFTPENTYRRRDRPGRLCRTCHNERQRRRWHELPTLRKPPKLRREPPPKKTVLQRFREKFVVDASGCWLWTAAKAQDTGYGVLQIGGKYYSAHRAAYELLVGPIAPGQVIHHRCGQRACVNPEHLEATSQHANLMATPETQAAKNAAKVVCIRGHADFVTDKSGHRYCKECNRLKQRAFRSQRRKS